MSDEINKEEETTTVEENFKQKEDSSKKNNNTKTCAVLAYFAVGIIWYFVDEDMKKNEFTKFHVKQALGLLIIDLVLIAALTISVVGWLVLPILNLVALVLAVVGIVNAINGEKKELPIIGVYSKKYLKF